MLKCLSIILLICSNVLARSARGPQQQQLRFHNEPTSPTNHQRNSIHSDSDQIQDEQMTGGVKPSNAWWNDTSIVSKVFQQCNEETLTVCLKIQLLLGLDKISHDIKEINLIDGVKFVQSSNDSQKQMLSEIDIERSLPRSLDDKENALNYLLLDKVISFVKTHTLQIKFPHSQDIARSLHEDGRKKKDKKGQGAFIMIPLLLAGTFIPIAYGALALLAGKALIVSKLALVLASIIGIKKLLSGGGHKESQHEVVVSSGGHGGSGWGRDFDLAYNGHNPANSERKTIQK